MSVDPGQDTGAAASTANATNGDSKASWEDPKDLYDHMGPIKKPKPPKPENAVTIAVSTRVLFRTETEQKIYEQRGIEEYLKYQVEHENEPFAPGPAFPFVKALETVNEQLRILYPESEELFDIVLVTYNHAHVGVRLINTINYHSHMTYNSSLMTNHKPAASWPGSNPNQLWPALISPVANNVNQA